MVEIHPIVGAVLLGVVSGFLISIPIGPINITIINEGAKRGFFWAFCIGLGATLMDVLYCAAAFAGFSDLFTAKPIRAVIEFLSFLVMLYLGVRYLRARELPATTHAVEVIEHKLHPHTAFTLGFVRVLGNPAVFLVWVALTATFMSHEWIANRWRDIAAFLAGTGTGALSWFLLLSFLVSLRHGRFSAKTLVRMSHFSGAGLLLVAVLIGIRLFRLLVDRG
jgi:L-lysine exporter family protein LysE/ArgO